MGDRAGELRGGERDGLVGPDAGPHMGHDEPPDAGGGSAPPGLRRGMMPGHLPVGLADEQVTVPREFDEGGTGLAVTGVDERKPAPTLDTQGERIRTGVLDGPRPQGQPADGGDVPVVQLLDGEGLLDGAALGPVGQEAGEPVGDAGGPEEGQGHGHVEPGVQQGVVGGEQIGAVIGVEMRDPDGVDVAERDVPLELGEGAGPGVHPDADAAALDEMAGAGVAGPRVRGGGPEDGDPQDISTHGPTLGLGAPPWPNLCRRGEERAYPVCSPGPIGGCPAETEGHSCFVHARSRP
ncbi:hypothetical protein BN2537_12183 [Streptomyces venezuelae]|nr:hypothetical protein BN2537_12183 [Streptomyces venezuelae]